MSNCCFTQSVEGVPLPSSLRAQLQNAQHVQVSHGAFGSSCVQARLRDAFAHVPHFLAMAPW